MLVIGAGIVGDHGIGDAELTGDVRTLQPQRTRLARR
jgi:hypothetical protein